MIHRLVLARLRGRTPRSALVASLVALGFAPAACAQVTDFSADDQEYRVVTVVDGLEFPWGLAFLPSGELLVTEKVGRLRVVRDGVLLPDEVAGLPEVAVRGQGGLLDVALHPDFENNRLVYLSFSKPGEGRTASTAVVRGRLDGMRLTGVEEIFEADAYGSGGNHFGSRLLFDRDGYLFITVGERGEMQEAQNPSNHQGTIIRLHDDGRVPADNPFVGREGFRPEIYAYGIRSPQGLTLHPETGEIWELEHGPRGGDEVNWIRPGRNYGWPVITYGINYNGTTIGEGLTELEGMEQPLHYWVPSIATSGMAFYTGDQFPAWRGSLFVGGLAGEQLARVSFDGHRSTGEETLMEGFGRVRDVRDGPDGYLYVLIDDDRAPLLRLEPSGG